MMVEPLSPMALPDAQASGSFGFWLLVLLVAVVSGADRLGTIDLPFTRKRRGLLVFGCWFCWWRLLQALIDWGQSIYHLRASGGVFWFLAVGLAGGGGFRR
jgi:hypothetical protein